MLWRVVAMAATPSAVSAMLLITELRRIKEQGPTADADEPSRAKVDFVCDASGSVSSTAFSSVVTILPTVQSQIMETVVTTITTVSTAADATSEAASRAAAATLDAASRAANSAMDAVSSLRRQINNSERISELRNEAETLANFQGGKAWLDLMRAMFAVGIAIAAADGEISESERQDIYEYVGGAAYQSLPTGLLGTVQAWLASPPTIEEAFELAQRCGEENMHLIEEVMKVAIHADSEEHPAELEFLNKWNRMREQANA